MGTTSRATRAHPRRMQWAATANRSSGPSAGLAHPDGVGDEHDGPAVPGQRDAVDCHRTSLPWITWRAKSDGINVGT